MGSSVEISIQFTPYGMPTVVLSKYRWEVFPTFESTIKRLLLIQYVSVAVTMRYCIMNPSVILSNFSDVIWFHKSWYRLALIMAYCVMPPSYYLNQCWLWCGAAVFTCEQFHGKCSWYRKITRLTQWGLVMQICVSKLTSIGSDNGL